MKCAECFLEDCHERNTDSVLNYSFTHSFLHSFVSRECVYVCASYLKYILYRLLLFECNRNLFESEYLTI